MKYTWQDCSRSRLSCKIQFGFARNAADGAKNRRPHLYEGDGSEAVARHWGSGGLLWMFLQGVQIAVRRVGIDFPGPVVPVAAFFLVPGSGGTAVEGYFHKYE